MLRYSPAFVRGVFIGCALSALVLLTTNLVYRGVTLSPDDSYGREPESFPLAEGRGLLLYESQANLEINSAEEVFTHKAVDVNENQLPSDVEEYKQEGFVGHSQPKKPLLIVVVTSRKLLQRTANRISRTWGGQTKDYSIIVGGGKNSDISGITNLLPVSYSDFPAFPYLSIGDLNFLLNLVRTEFAEQYDWFLFVSSNTYISVPSLERFLNSMDASKPLYMGYPSNKTLPMGLLYCEGGPGLVFSHTALSGITEPCVGGSSSREEPGYRDLGKCVVGQLKVDCYGGLNVPLQNHFLFDRNITSLKSELLWKKSAFQTFLTLYPVRDQHHMDTLHSLSQAREIARGLRRSEEIEGALRTHEHCQDFPENCNISANVSKSAYSYTYSNFSRDCEHFPRGYSPEVRRKVINWDSVAGHTIYNSWELDPQALVHGDLSRELKYATNVAMELVRAETPNVALHNVASLYVRYRGSVGREFMFDLELNRTKGEVLQRRVSLLMPHDDQVLLDTPVTISKGNLVQVNFIVPLNGLDRKKVAKFQRTYYNLCVKRTDNCRVMYVIFSSSVSDVNFMRGYLSRFQRRHSKFIYQYIVGEGRFEMEKAYSLGVSKLKDTELAFIASVDLSLADHFLTRCRANTARGSRIYYPEVFSYYNMPYVYRGKWHPRNYEYARMHGRWATHSVGCLYKSDYTAIGGYGTLKHWEFEPPTSLVHGTLEVMRAPDPGISHWYEATKCDSNLPPNQFSSCLSRQSDNLADRLSLAGYLLALEEKCGDDHKT